MVFGRFVRGDVREPPTPAPMKNRATPPGKEERSQVFHIEFIDFMIPPGVVEVNYL